MTQHHPPEDDARREVTTDLRRARSEQREPDATLVPVEGGEPMPAEERPPAARHPIF